MISKRDLDTRGRGDNPYGLTQKQLNELEVTKAEVAEHLKNVDFSKHDDSQPTTSNPDLEHQAKRLVDFISFINPKRRRTI